jgi:hypothetical protein
VVAFSVAGPLFGARPPPRLRLVKDRTPAAGTPAFQSQPETLLPLSRTWIWSACRCCGSCRSCACASCSLTQKSWTKSTCVWFYFCTSFCFAFRYQNRWNTYPLQICEHTPINQMRFNSLNILPYLRLCQVNSGQTSKNLQLQLVLQPHTALRLARRATPTNQACARQAQLLSLFVLVR